MVHTFDSRHSESMTETKLVDINCLYLASVIAEHHSARQLIRECSEISTLVCIYIYIYMYIYIYIYIYIYVVLSRLGMQ